MVSLPAVHEFLILSGFTRLVGATGDGSMLADYRWAMNTAPGEPSMPDLPPLSVSVFWWLNGRHSTHQSSSLSDEDTAHTKAVPCQMTTLHTPKQFPVRRRHCTHQSSSLSDDDTAHTKAVLCQMTTLHTPKQFPVRRRHCTHQSSSLSDDDTAHTN